VTVEQELWGLLSTTSFVEMERVVETAGVEPTRISFVAVMRLKSATP
jgi:hypothetical protein